MTQNQAEVIIAQTSRTRDQARTALDQLARATAEMEGAPRSADAMRVVTGRTSVEVAIDSAQRLLERVDRSLSEAHRKAGVGLDAPPAPCHRGEDDHDGLHLRVHTRPVALAGADRAFPQA